MATRIFVGGRSTHDSLDREIERESNRLFTMGQLRADRRDDKGFTAYFNGLLNAFMQLAVALGHRAIAIQMRETALELLRGGDDLQRSRRLH